MVQSLFVLVISLSNKIMNTLDINFQNYCFMIIPNKLRAIAL